MSVTIVSLDGIPGAGKSTLLRELSSKLHGISRQKIICLQEPVEEWSRLIDSAGNTLFSLYYNDQKRYALAFQLQVLHTRFELLENTINENPDAMIITERDLMTDYKIFTQMLYDRGMFEEIEFKLYKTLYDSYQRRLDALCSVTKKRIYLTTSAKVSYQRMKFRDRKEEREIEIEYLENVEKYHKSVLLSEKEVLCIDGDEECKSLSNDKFYTILDYLLK